MPADAACNSTGIVADLDGLCVQARLEGLVGKSSGLIETLPKPIQRRIKYLQTLQGEYDEREEEYERELDELDKKYEKIYGESPIPSV